MSLWTASGPSETLRNELMADRTMLPNRSQPSFRWKGDKELSSLSALRKMRILGFFGLGTCDVRSSAEAGGRESAEAEGLSDTVKKLLEGDCQEIVLTLATARAARNGLMTVMLVNGAGRPSHVTGIMAKDVVTARGPEPSELQQEFLPVLTALQETRAPWEEVERQLTRLCAKAARRNAEYHERRRRPATWRPPNERPPADRPPAAPPAGEPRPPPAEQEPEPAEDHRRPWQPPAYAAEEASRLQKLYRSNRDKAVRQVLREETPPCPVPGEQLAAHFAPPPCPPVEWDRRPQEVPDLTPAAPSPALTAPFRADELFVNQGGGRMDSSNSGKVFRQVWEEVMGDDDVPHLTAQGIRYGTVIGTSNADPGKRK
ncbi:hypothetical protein FJT64_025127 [Amphibalanus amphitrite]|uniref:Uncharacterized protein n=1 Tax=Amphibalanus amphitrite TaxID=1232801 RepID=A0A6A4W658_AMPAM|nr:hypothetical protein FJT64_025127 [Amphibalanus amphitrite]